MGCAEGFIKLIVFGVNLVFALAGLALVTVGVLYKLDLTQYTEAIPKDYENIGLAPILTIVIGSIIFVVAFFGCCGAIRESPCLLTTYAVILLIIFLLQIALGVFAFLEIKDKDTLKSKITYTLEQLFNEYRAGNRSRELVDLIQSELKCCGINGPSFWQDEIPSSCCQDSCETKIYFSTPCPSAFFDMINSSIQIIAITVLAMSAIEVLGAIFSLCLSNTIRNRERRFRY